MTVKINLTDLQSVPQSSPLFIRFHLPYKTGFCGSVCPDSPHYRCTRVKGHENEIGIAGKQDHVAHGHFGRMFARWNGNSNGNGGDRQQAIVDEVEVEVEVEAEVEAAVEVATIETETGKMCEDCGGTGIIIINEGMVAGDLIYDETADCGFCGGSGRIPKS